MHFKLQCLIADYKSSFSSAAYVTRSTWKTLGCGFDFYVIIEANDASKRLFYLEVDNDVGIDGCITIDHWPDNKEFGQKSLHESMVNVEVIAPAFVPSVECIQLAPLTDHPSRRLPKTFLRSLLLHRHIIHGSSGVVDLQKDGVTYGRWSYRAYSRRQSRTLGDATGCSAAVVNKDTILLSTPFVPSKIAEGVDASIPPHAERLHQMISLGLQPRNFDRSGLQIRSILIDAPSGAGKTTAVELSAKALDVNLLKLDGGILANTSVRIEEYFTAALRMRPCILLLDELELLCPNVEDQLKYKFMSRLVTTMQATYERKDGRVLVLGAVSSVSTLHPSIRQVFDEEEQLPLPSEQWSMDILSSMLLPYTTSRQALRSVVVRYGQQPGHLSSIARYLHAHDIRNKANEITESALLEAGRKCIHTSSQTFTTSIPNVSWNDIGGLDSIKQKLIEMVVWPLERPHVFTKMGISPPRGVMLHGPPGTGKTLLAKAAAKASGCNFLNVAASDIMQAELGESEKAIARAFATARSLSPCLVFIDEFQALFGDRSTSGTTTSQMISQLLMELDSIHATAMDEEDHNDSSKVSSTGAGRIFVLAATNYLSAVDPAFLQPGRFENVLYVGLPGADERKLILQLQASRMPWSEDVDLDTLVHHTEGANAATLVALCQAAAMETMQRTSTADNGAAALITMDDFHIALGRGRFYVDK